LFRKANVNVTIINMVKWTKVSNKSTAVYLQEWVECVQKVLPACLKTPVNPWDKNHIFRWEGLVRWKLNQLRETSRDKEAVTEWSEIRSYCDVHAEGQQNQQRKCLFTTVARQRKTTQQWKRPVFYLWSVTRMTQQWEQLSFLCGPFLGYITSVFREPSEWALPMNCYLDVVGGLLPLWSERQSEIKYLAKASSIEKTNPSYRRGGPLPNSVGVLYMRTKI
jgi:hypothetical protein